MFEKFRSFFNRIRSFFAGARPEPPPAPLLLHQPYQDSSANQMYNSLFCDNIELFKPAGKLEGPWQVLFSKNPTEDSLKSIAQDNQLETRVSLLAYNILRNRGVVNPKVVHGVVVEMGLAEGLSTIAVFTDFKAWYVNHAGKIFTWQDGVPAINEKIQNIITIAQKVIGKAEAWTQPRLSPPATGGFRITFLVADGFYFGEGKLDGVKGDAVAAAIISQAGELMLALAKNVQSTGGTPAPKAEEILKISVLKSGQIKVGDNLVSLPQVEKMIADLAAKNGSIWYYRESGEQLPPAQAKEVIRLAMKYKRPVSLSSKPDFSDTIDEKGVSRPRVKQ